MVSTLTALVFGLVPAWQASRVEPQAALREQSRGGTADRRHHQLRSLLVVTEVALAVVLLVGAGLLLRTFSSLIRVDPGFKPAETITMGLFLGLRPPEARIAVIDRILERVEAVPGVTAASTIQFLPLTGMTCGTGFVFEGQAPGDASATLPTDCSLISRGYFDAMGIPVLEGRPFDRRDRAGTPRVLVVNQSFARRYFPDGRVLGRRILVHGSNQALAQIVGVVGDVRHNGLTTEPAPTVFLLHAQTPGYITTLVVRTSGEARAKAGAPAARSGAVGWRPAPPRVLCAVGWRRPTSAAPSTRRTPRRPCRASRACSSTSGMPWSGRGCMPRSWPASRRSR